MSRHRKPDEELKCNCGHCPMCWHRNWLRTHPGKSAAYTRRWLDKNPERKVRRLQETAEYFDAKHRQATCTALKKHAEDLKFDPERLSTEFMQRIIGIKCKKGVE